MKKNYSKILGSIFIISLLWILGRTGANFLLYGMDANFVSGEWKKCFVYSPIDIFFIALAFVTLMLYIIFKIKNKNDENSF